jgi:hypothetical protein
MEDNLALQVKANRGDPVSIEVLCSMRSEAHSEVQRKIEVIAQAQFFSDRNNILFEMQVDVQEDVPDNQGNVHEVMEDVLPAWQEYLPIQGDTAAGTNSDALSTAGQYERGSHKVWISFQASLTTDTLTRHNLTSKDFYLPGRSDDYVNHRLA